MVKDMLVLHLTQLAADFLRSGGTWRDLLAQARLEAAPS